MLTGAALATLAAFLYHFSNSVLHGFTEVFYAVPGDVPPGRSFPGVLLSVKTIEFFGVHHFKSPCRVEVDAV
jgi:hypothetical protein